MNHGKAFLVIGAFAAVTGCVPEAWHGDPTLPGSSVKFTDPGRTNPWERLEASEHQYRDVAKNFGWNTGLDKLRYPTTGKLAMAWSYVYAGRDFEAHGEHGAAARAHWAALALTRKAVGSRPDRERIKRAAYKDLAAIARARKQPQWADLLDLCGELSGVYLEGDQAHADHNAYYAELGRLEQAEAEALEERRRAQAALNMQMVNAAFNQVNAQAQAVAKGASGTAVDRAEAQRMSIEALGQGFKQAAELQQKSADVSDAFKDTMGKLGTGAAKFQAVAAEDVAEVEAGASFVAIEASFYLSTTKKTERYIPVLKSFAKGRPALAAAVERLAQAKATDDREESIGQIAKGLKEIEVTVARCERRGRACEAGGNGGATKR